MLKAIFSCLSLASPNLSRDCLHTFDNQNYLATWLPVRHFIIVSINAQQQATDEMKLQPMKLPTANKVKSKCLHHPQAQVIGTCALGGKVQALPMLHHPQAQVIGTCALGEKVQGHLNNKTPRNVTETCSQYTFESTQESIGPLCEAKSSEMTPQT